ncbi:MULTISPECIES: hypothetical protein [Photorhabdus]|uniref:RING-type E3 ubiquitin transferase n=2 Tax=Photorhabdus asymbiotica TaxID=291112 RepID=B6VMX1_PHOAA|nr:hypothetical protein [Photorhabdus asymbiotica]RKS54072.1 hypothetical protein BDD30_4433 [Photorhabdus asymbiotica]CAQ85157.1 conserved hypothetical protein [Photorhabdus asymbiotica]CAR67501.1 Hypothetical Protein PA-RVA15-17-0931 [Photorhabdus asymbiotica subsp. asymbiotica ATCC 43949]
MVSFIFAFVIACVLIYTIYFILKETVGFKWLRWLSIPLIAGIIAICYFDDPFGHFFNVFIGSLLFIFVLPILINIISFGKSAAKYYRQARQSDESASKATWEMILGSAAIAILLISFFISPYALFGLLFLLFIHSRLKTTPENKFLKFQQIIPTSKIRSIAMGLVEIEGKITEGKQFKSPLSKKLCYGYRYYEYNVRTDSKGSKRYSLRHSEEKISQFTLTDHSGSVRIEATPETLTFVNFSLYQNYEIGSISYQEYLLFPDEEYLIIGTAVEKDNQVVITQAAPHQLLGIASTRYLDTWNEVAPMRRNLAITVISAAILIAFILTVPYEYHSHHLTVFYRESPLLKWLF